MDLGASGGAVPSESTQYTSLPFSIDETDVVDDAIPITFAFRNDYPGLLEFWGAELFDVNTSSQQNLLANKNFTGAGVGSKRAPSWTHAQPTNGLGVVAAFFSNGCPMGNCWVDATAGGYDELRQTIGLNSVVLNSHDQYEISFFVSDPNAQSNWTWRQYSTIDSSPFPGNATDILVYVGKVGPYTNVETSQPPPPPVPEPSTWAMMLLGFAGLGLLGYRRGSARASQAEPEARVPARA